MKEKMFEELLDKAHELYHLKENIELLEKGLNRSANFRLCDLYENVPSVTVSSTDVKKLIEEMKKRFDLGIISLSAIFRTLDKEEA